MSEAAIGRPEEKTLREQYVDEDDRFIASQPT